MDIVFVNNKLTNDIAILSSFYMKMYNFDEPLTNIMEIYILKKKIYC